MNALSATASKSAKMGSAKSCGRNRNTLRFGSRVMQAARGIYPTKTAINLSLLTGDPVRTWEYWLSKERMPAEALGALLESEHGMEFLEAVAGGATWWRRVRSAIARADEQQHRMQEAANALRALVTPETAVANGFQDVAGIANRPLARTAKA
jgi:hypothetical protein